MRVQIYQINFHRDNNDLKYKPVNDIVKIEPSMYDEVLNAVLDDGTPEAVYNLFNTEGHPLFRGIPLSESDIVVIDENAYLRRSDDFIQTSFDVSATQKPDNLMRIVYVEPNKPAYETEILHTLEAEQKAVGGGLIQVLYWNDDNTAIVANDESKLNGMPGNRRFGDGTSIIAGPFFVCGLTEDNFRSLTDEEVMKYMNKFAVPDEISQDEVEADMGFEFITM